MRCVDVLFVQVDRLLEALVIWKSESDELHHHEKECQLAGKEVRESEREKERERERERLVT